MNWVRQGRLQLPEEEIEAQMFDETIEAMEKKDVTNMKSVILL